MKMRLLAILLSPICFGTAVAGSEPDTVQLMQDPGFEDSRLGILESRVAGKKWEVQRIGRQQIQEALVVKCFSDKRLAHEGNNVLKLSLPKDTVGFEFVTVGQRLKLQADRQYTATVWVRWPDGPEKAPAKANSTSGHPSAIVSFWVRHKEATGGFAGRDVWLFDRDWKKMTLRFHATDPSQKSLVYVSLLPNQTPRATTVLVDDFTLHAVPTKAAVAKEDRQSVTDGGFAKLKPGPIGLGMWSFTNRGGSKILGEVVEQTDDRYFRIAMNKNTSNYESAQLFQMLHLNRGVRYEVECRMRWDSYQEGPRTPIVNYGFYHEESNTWYGPIDQYLRKSKDWETYKFIHIPPYDGKWKLYVQLNGWGNFGNQLTVSFDDFSCRPPK